MIHALYLQWGSGLLKREESKTIIIPDKNQRNFVILTTERRCSFDDFLPRKKTYLANNGISIVENTINDSLWR